MKRYFFDSSALAKLFVAEKGTDVVVGLVERTGDRFRLFSAITPLEVRSALQRRRRSGDLNAEDAEEAIGLLADEMRRTVQIPLTQSLMQAAQETIDSFGLRAGDAIQLASAITFAGAEANVSLVFVASDMELLNAARLAGLETMNPETI